MNNIANELINLIEEGSIERIILKDENYHYEVNSHSYDIYSLTFIDNSGEFRVNNTDLIGYKIDKNILEIEVYDVHNTMEE